MVRQCGVTVHCPFNAGQVIPCQSSRSRFHSPRMEALRRQAGTNRKRKHARAREPRSNK